MNKHNTNIFPANKAHYPLVNKYNYINSNFCLIVPVSIHQVCSNSHVLVIVEVYVKNKIYSRKIKNVFTISTNNTDCRSLYYNKNHLIEYMFIDKFKFYFSHEYNPKHIKVAVDIQYI